MGSWIDWVSCLLFLSKIHLCFAIQLIVPVINIEVIPNELGLLIVPQHVTYALSTDGQTYLYCMDYLSYVRNLWQVRNVCTLVVY
jgi:hypothetical protein